MTETYGLPTGVALGLYVGLLVRMTKSVPCIWRLHRSVATRRNVQSYARCKVWLRSQGARLPPKIGGPQRAAQGFAVDARSCEETVATLVCASGSAAHDLGGIDSLGGVSRVYHQLRLIDNGRVIVAAVIGNDYESIVLA